MAASEDSILLFDRINLARCAMERAHQNIFNEEVFQGEYQSARLWSKYKCVITKTYSFVETD